MDACLCQTCYKGPSQKQAIKLQDKDSLRVVKVEDPRTLSQRSRRSRIVSFEGHIATGEPRKTAALEP